VRLVAPAGVATGDASDRRLHFETVPTRALVLRRFPAQRPNPCEIFRRSPEGRSRPGASRLRARPREGLLLRAASPVRRRALRATGSSGPPDANEAGENRVSRRGSHFGDRAISCSGVFFRHAGVASRSPLTLLSPPPTPRTASLFFESCARLGKPPRSDPRGPRERRALYRPGAPSADSRRAQPARAEARTNPHDLPRSYDAHVMRIAALQRTAPLLPAEHSCAYAPGYVRRSGSRSRAPRIDQAFDLTGTGGTLLWARGRSTDFCNTCDARAPTWATPRPRSAGGSDSLSLPSPRPPPCGDGDGLTSRAIPRLRRSVSSHGPDQLEWRFALPFRQDEAPPRTSRAHPFRRAGPATRGGNLSRNPARTGRTSSPREREGEPSLGLRFPHRPAKGGAFSRRPRCVPPPCAWTDSRIAPRVRPSGYPDHAAPVPRRTPTPCR